MSRLRRLFHRVIDRAGNLPPLRGIYPDYGARIIRNRPKATW